MRGLSLNCRLSNLQQNHIERPTVRAGLEAIRMFKPLAKAEQPYPWVNETKVAPLCDLRSKRSRVAGESTGKSSIWQRQRLQ